MLGSLFIEQIGIEFPLCAKHCAGCWGHKHEENLAKTHPVMTVHVNQSVTNRLWRKLCYKYFSRLLFWLLNNLVKEFERWDWQWTWQLRSSRTQWNVKHHMIYRNHRVRSSGRKIHHAPHIIRRVKKKKINNLRQQKLESDIVSVESFQ